ncbi:MAG: recombination mediator RecR [Desulfobulbaceae bacterium]|jgi:recombination protein RecR|nr:recombination mediator RecR [Desulfobulbaceae bacterium]
MQVVPPALERLILDLSKLPGIGKKTASRLALHIMRSPAEEARSLAADLAELHTAVKLCSICFIFSETDPCKICSDHTRNTGVVCVVEGSDDLLAIEKTGAYQGLYHILHGVLAPMDGIGPDEIKINELIERIRRHKISEILIATSSTVPGEATASYLARILHKEPVKVTRLACGIPMGMDIKYADEVTLARAIETRQESK